MYEFTFPVMNIFHFNILKKSHIDINLTQHDMNTYEKLYRVRIYKHNTIKLWFIFSFSD